MGSGKSVTVVLSSRFGCGMGVLSGLERAVDELLDDRAVAVSGAGVGHLLEHLLDDRAEHERGIGLPAVIDRDLACQRILALGPQRWAW